MAKNCKDLSEICSPVPCIACKGIFIHLWTESEGRDFHLALISFKGKIQAWLKSRDRNALMCWPWECRSVLLVPCIFHFLWHAVVQIPAEGGVCSQLKGSLVSSPEHPSEGECWQSNPQLYSKFSFSGLSALTYSLAMYNLESKSCCTRSENAW